MTILMPTVECKPTDPGVFLTPLFQSTSSFLITNAFYYGLPQASAKTFARNEQLTNLIFPLALNANFYGLTFNVSLTEFKSCTVSSATPAVVTITSHGYSTGDKVRFAASTAPTGMIRGLAYYVNVQSANTFWLYDTYANAIAGGSTGRLNTTSTGSSVVCYKIIEEKVYNYTDVYGDVVSSHTASRPLVYFHTSGWTTTIDTAANKWAFMVSTDEPTATSTSTSNASLSGNIVAYGTATQSATTNVDSFCITKKMDFTEGWTFNGYSLMPGYYNNDPFLNPMFVVDPTQATIGNITTQASSAIIGASFSSLMIGKNLKFTSDLASGSTSATLSTAFDGVSGTYKVQLFHNNETGDLPQVDMTFTNGSTSVTFSALSGSFSDYAVIVMPLSQNYTWTVNDGSKGIVFDQTSVENAVTIVGEKYYNKTWTTLDAGLTVGDSSLVTKDETNWQIGDTFYLGGNLVSNPSSGDKTVYTITNISTTGGKDTITFSPNLATYDRAEMGAVALYQATQNAVKFIRGTGTQTAQIELSGTFASLLVASVECAYVQVAITGNAYKGNINSWARRSFWLNCWAGSQYLFIGFRGATIRDVNASKAQSPNNQEITGLATADTYIQDYLLIWQTSGITAVKQRAKYNNIRVEGYLGNGSQSSNFSTLPSTTVKNLYIWVTNRGGVSPVIGIFGSHTGGTFENVYIDGADYAVQLSNTPFVTYKNVYFGTIVPNTYDISTGSNVNFVDLEFHNIVGNYTYYDTNQIALSSFSRIRITDANGVAGANRVIQQFGETNITGTGLADTTEHNGNPCIKFTSNYAYEPLEWEQVIPTGNIQNKDMMVGIWVKLANANYWAGTHQMPRLTITYDATSVAYAEAAQTTDWQFLSVPIHPLTIASSIKAKLTTQSDAVGSDTDVYFADYSVLYPAGYTLNLGVFDNYTGGFPTVPTISTSVSALDVWAADPTQFGAATVGDKVNKMKNETGLIPALL